MKSEALIHAYLFKGDGYAKRMSWEDVLAWKAADGVLWTHFLNTDPDVIHWMHNNSGLDPLVTDILISQDTRPRATALGEGLLLALRGVNLNPGSDPEDMVSIRLWVNQQRIVSTVRRNLLSAGDIVQLFEQGKGPRSSADFIVAITDRIIMRMSATVDDLEDRIGELEDHVLADTSNTIRNDLANLRRTTISLRRYLSPQKEALSRLLIEQVDILDDIHRMRLREVSDRLLRHIEDIDEVRDRAAVTHEELVSRASEQLNKRMYVLSIVAAIFMPLGFFTGLLGINVGGIPGSDNSGAFTIFVGILILLVSAQIIFFKWKKWF